MSILKHIVLLKTISLTISVQKQIIKKPSHFKFIQDLSVIAYLGIRPHVLLALCVWKYISYNNSNVLKPTVERPIKGLTIVWCLKENDIEFEQIASLPNKKSRMKSLCWFPAQSLTCRHSNIFFKCLHKVTSWMHCWIQRNQPRNTWLWIKMHFKKNQAVSTEYYLVTSSTEMLRSVNYWLQGVAELLFFSWLNLYWSFIVHVHMVLLV